MGNFFREFWIHIFDSRIDIRGVPRVKENHVPQDVKFFYPFRPEIQAFLRRVRRKNANRSWISGLMFMITPRKFTPLKFNMEPDNDGFQNESPFPAPDGTKLFRFHV